jgi:two-component system OmpR family response regulator/two-component system response regulator MprA
MTRILLVEDERQVAAFVQQGLSEEGYAVEWAATGAEGERRALGEAFDAVLLDLRLPDRSGVEVCRSIRRHKTALPILMLTALDGVEDRVEGLRAGADDYLPKPFAFAELVARIEALLRRAALEPAGRAHRDGDLVVDPAARTCHYHERALDLTQTEFDLLAYFVARRGQALSRDEIHRDVWGHDFDRGTNLIDVYVGYVRRKLADVGCASRIETVRGVGYRYVPAREGALAEADAPGLHA